MILGLGHPRTGTGYTAKLCRLWGLKVGHEMPRADGVVGWQYVHPTGPYPFDASVQSGRPQYDHLIYNVRDPSYSLASIIHTEDIVSDSRKFRSNLIDIPSKNKVEFAISSIITFDKLITELKPNITYRIEDQQQELFDYLSGVYPLKYVESTNKTNTREHSGLEAAIGGYEVSTLHRDLLDAYCDKHGYNQVKF